MNKIFLKPKQEFNISNNKKYKVEIIKNRVVYIKKIVEYLLSLYYLVFLKKLLRRKKYIRTFFYSYTPLKNNLCILQRLSNKIK